MTLDHWRWERRRSCWLVFAAWWPPRAVSQPRTATGSTWTRTYSPSVFPTSHPRWIADLSSAAQTHAPRSPTQPAARRKWRRYSQPWWWRSFWSSWQHRSLTFLPRHSERFWSRRPSVCSTGVRSDAITVWASLNFGNRWRQWSAWWRLVCCEAFWSR